MSEDPKRVAKATKASTAIAALAAIAASVAALAESVNKTADEIKKLPIPGVSAIQQSQATAAHASLTDKVTYSVIGLFVIFVVSPGVIAGYGPRASPLLAWSISVVDAAAGGGSSGASSSCC